MPDGFEKMPMPKLAGNTHLKKTLRLIKSSPGYISGEEIARALRISRSAVWKQICRLRQEGFSIDARSGAGYRLLSLPDKVSAYEIAEGIETVSVGREIFYYASTESTNKVAKTRALNGAADGSVIIAEEQTRGRGRLDRNWLSPPGKNILLSIIFRPGIQPREVFSLTMLSSLGVIKAIESRCGLSASIKWPNDIYIGHLKTGGILTEFNAEQDRVDFAVVGIGLNVNFDPAGYPEIAGIATSLSRESGKEISRVSLVQAMLKEIDTLYTVFKRGGFSQIFVQWKACSMVIGKAVTVISQNRMEHGVVDSIREDGCLILQVENGGRKQIFSGDVSLRFQE
ncbi:MAG: biotin--[acetyl-CoA-carboxylase] ligase [Desulfobacterales bacterium]|nr:biotin--[acetyl-CoA-carboxylase] ligase [Desulfobacterales bacterium]